MNSFNSKSIFQFASKSDIIKIITITSLFFVIFQFTRLTFLINSESDAPFFTHFYNKFALPPTFKQLLYQPWSLLTYMFSELSIMHIIGNMIWLWIFGTVIEDLKGSNRILPIYLVGGLVGALTMMLYIGLKPGAQVTHYAGSLAALSAVAIATLMYKPKYKFTMFFGLEIPIWIFVAVFIALNIATLQSYNLSLLFLVIGGVFVGLGYTNLLHSFFERCTLWFNRVGDYMGNNENFIVKKSNTIRNKTMLHLGSKNIVQKSQSIDDILDKITEKGIQSLTKEEQKSLEEYGKNE